jgi:hypothetical protein
MLLHSDLSYVSHLVSLDFAPSLFLFFRPFIFSLYLKLQVWQDGDAMYDQASSTGRIFPQQ